MSVVCLSVVCVCSRYNILICGKIIKEMPGSVASGTPDSMIALKLTAHKTVTMNTNKPAHVVMP